MKIQNIIKTTNIIKINANETLSSALNKLSSSHDAGFVFSDENKYLGVINPYYSVIKSSYPGNTKIEHCLFHAPHIKTNFSISKVAQLMIESKIHYLPVFNDNDNSIGIVSARRLIFSLRDSVVFNLKIKEVLKVKKPPLVTVFEDDFISLALNLFKTYKVSKLVVINRDMKLRGILSYYDLICFLVAPKEKEQRGERLGNKVNLGHRQVKNFSKNFVLTLTPEDSLKRALNLIIDKRIGSVVIVDGERHPIGIITTRDFLRLLVREHNDKKIEITSKNLSQENRQILGGFFNHFALWIKKIPDLTKAKLFVKEEKGGGLFEVILSLIPKKGAPKVIKREGKNLSKILRKIKKD